MPLATSCAILITMGSSSGRDLSFTRSKRFPYGMNSVSRQSGRRHTAVRPRMQGCLHMHMTCASRRNSVNACDPQRVLSFTSSMMSFLTATTCPLYVPLLTIAVAPWPMACPIVISLMSAFGAVRLLSPSSGTRKSSGTICPLPHLISLSPRITAFSHSLITNIFGACTLLSIQWMHGTLMTVLSLKSSDMNDVAASNTVRAKAQTSGRAPSFPRITTLMVPLLASRT